MPKYAYFDPTVSEPSPVIGWFDTDFTEYSNLPPEDSLLEVSEELWMTDLGAHLAVSGGKLVPYTPEPQQPPELPPPQPSVADLLARIEVLEQQVNKGKPKDG